MTNLKLEDNTLSTISKEILEKTKKSLGFIPNMYLKMSNNTSLLDAYTYSYNSFRSNSGFTFIEQEVIFLSVAYENECEYCVAAHSFVGDKMSGVPKDVTDAIREGKKISDTKLNALSLFARIVTRTRANISNEEIIAFLKEGYNENDILGVITGVGVKTFCNYINHLVSTPLDEMFKERKWNKQ